MLTSIVKEVRLIGLTEAGMAHPIFVVLLNRDSPIVRQRNFLRPVFPAAFLFRFDN